MALFGDLAEEATEFYRLASVKVSLDGDVSVITLTGEVDLAMTESLDDACREVIDRGLPVRIDASRLVFIDSSGLGFLVRVVQSSPGGVRPKLIGATRLIRDTVRIVGLAELVEMV